MRKTADKIKNLGSSTFTSLASIEKTQKVNFSSLFSKRSSSLCAPFLKNFFQHSCFHLASLAQAPDMSTIIVDIEEAFKHGRYPELNTGGTSESYIMKDSDGYPLAIFKPWNASWGYDAHKEIAAYRLDHYHFAKVPATVMATFSHPFFLGDEKIRHGSCQRFVNDSVTAVYVNRQKMANIPQEHIRRIAILDIRLINSDRHSSNLLYRDCDHRIELIPIDHGAILPESLFGPCFAWINWEQADTPFTQEELDYIEALNPLADASLLIDELHIPLHSAENMIGATCLLKEAALRGMNASKIGRCIARKNSLKEGKRVWESSLLENVMQGVREKSYSHFNELLRAVQHQVELHLNIYTIHVPKAGDYAAC